MTAQRMFSTSVDDLSFLSPKSPVDLRTMSFFIVVWSFSSTASRCVAAAIPYPCAKPIRSSASSHARTENMWSSFSRTNFLWRVFLSTVPRSLCTMRLKPASSPS
eukprot:Amastigsp_a515780_3.p5 type:complete len:105 gc:universal Amastigsp_a515780_3:1113-799(-)